MMAAMSKNACVNSFAPGRTEIAGNHTDHQGGRVIAAALDCGISMLVEAREDGHVHVESEGFDTFEIDVADCSPREDERLGTQALVRGMVAGLRARGVRVGGFDVKAKSTIPSGGGLSSSAAFELALGEALNVLYADGRVAPSDMVAAAVEAERGWFGKPCGFMDQLAVEFGGINLFDFSQMPAWTAHPIEFNLQESGYALYLVDTHCDHSLYTDEYAHVASDMNNVARELGARVLANVPERDFLRAFPDLRRKLGDRSVLRACHYYNEMRLVDGRAEALVRGDMDAFLSLTRASSASSAQFLQNVSTFDAQQQPAMVALAVVAGALGGKGALRIHGGGFGGTIQAFVPENDVDGFVETVDGLLGDGSCRRFSIGGKGAHASWQNR